MLKFENYSSRAFTLPSQRHAFRKGYELCHSHLRMILYIYIYCISFAAMLRMKEILGIMRRKFFSCFLLFFLSFLVFKGNRWSFHCLWDSATWSSISSLKIQNILEDLLVKKSETTAHGLWMLIYAVFWTLKKCYSWLIPFFIIEY